MSWEDIVDNFTLESEGVIEWINNEYLKIRSGRVNINIFNNVFVNSYGEKVKLNTISNIQLVDAHNVLIKPYDRSQIKDIAEGINNTDLHVNPIVNADSIRITFPPQTEENRIINVKKAKATLETAKQRIRDVRKEAQGEYKKLTGISEDLLHHYEEELNNLTKEQNNLLEKIFISKENELMKL